MAEGRSNVSRFFEIHKVYRKDPDGSMKLTWGVTYFHEGVFLYIGKDYEDCERLITEEA